MTKRDVLLWTPILVAPSVWFLSFTANFAIAPLACRGGGKVALYSVSIVSLLITAAAALLAFRLWRRFQREKASVAGAPAERTRSMAMAGLVLCLGFFLVIFAQSLPHILLAGCE